MCGGLGEGRGQGVGPAGPAGARPGVRHKIAVRASLSPACRRRLTLSCLPPSLPAAAQVGLSYICATAERFFAVGAVLSSMVTGLAEQPSVRLLKHIVRCYLRLSDNPRAREALRQCLPDLLRNPAFTACLKVGGTRVLVCWGRVPAANMLLSRDEPSGQTMHRQQRSSLLGILPSG